jgi:hypothetical protein
VADFDGLFSLPLGNKPGITSQFNLEFRPACVDWVVTQLFSETTAAAAQLTKSLGHDPAYKTSVPCFSVADFDGVFSLPLETSGCEIEYPGKTSRR